MNNWVHELDRTLDRFVREEENIIQQEFRSVAKETAEMLKGTSPKGPDGYASGWKVLMGGKKTYGGFHLDYIVGNPKFYMLTHLLEKGHQVYNQYGGSYGRARAIPHIKPAEEWGKSMLLSRLRSRL